MILGFTPFTWFHTILSLVALVAGFVVVRDLFASRTPSSWTATYIATAVLTSVTGFGFNFPFGASHVVGIISLVILVGVIAAYYVFQLGGAWRWMASANSVPPPRSVAARRSQSRSTSPRRECRSRSPCPSLVIFAIPPAIVTREIGWRRKYLSMPPTKSPMSISAWSGSL